MIEVMVVIYGLVMFVPTGSGSQNCDHAKRIGCTAEQLTAIFVNGGNHVGGMHQPIIQWLGTDGNLQVKWPLTADFQVVVENPEAGLIGLDAWTAFPRLGAFSSSRVPPNCLKHDGVCESGRKDLTYGVATFSGKWTAAGATHCCGFKLPVGDYDQARVKFPRADGTEPDTFGERPIATALVLRTTLNDTQWQNLKVMLGQSDQKGTPLSGGACEQWISAGTKRCAVLVMGNPPTEYAPCVGTKCRYDHHFSAFYLLMQDGGDQSARRIPYVTGSAICPHPDAVRDLDCLSANLAWVEYPLEPQNMPSVRCPPAFAQIDPAAVIERE